MLYAKLSWKTNKDCRLRELLVAMHFIMPVDSKSIFPLYGEIIQNKNVRLSLLSDLFYFQMLSVIKL